MWASCGTSTAAGSSASLSGSITFRNAIAAACVVFLCQTMCLLCFFGKPSVLQTHSTTTGRPSSEFPSDRSSPLFVPDDSPRGNLESTAEEALARSDWEGQPTSHHQPREIRRERRRHRRGERQSRQQERRREHAVEQVPAVSRNFSPRFSRKHHE